MRYIETFKDGDRISEVYLCKSKSSALTKAGKEYENVILIQPGAARQPGRAKTIRIRVRDDVRGGSDA